MVRVCGNREDAEDVLIEALLKAYRNLDDLSAPEAFRSWLGRIASRVCWQLRRREALAPLLQLSVLEEDGGEVADRGPSAEELAGVAEMKEIFAVALRSLSEGTRAAYQLRAVEELSGEETARRLGISLAAMKSRLLRARKLLRERLDAALIVPQSGEPLNKGQITPPIPSGAKARFDSGEVMHGLKPVPFSLRT